MDDTMNTKPKWLEQLEAESWQAELIISGIAIFASTYLPSLAERLVTFVLVATPPVDHVIFYYAFLYLYIGVYAVIVGLVVHFVARTFWIGLVGFNSVFPKGIDLEHNGTYSNYYVRKISSHLPHRADNMIQMLDRFCSPIFAITALILIFNIVLVFDLGMVYLLKVISDLVLPEGVTMYIFYAFLVTVVISAVLMLALNTRKLKQNESAQHLYYRISYWTNFLLLHVFYKPAQYLLMTLVTTSESKNMLRNYFFASMIGGLLSVPAISSTDFKYFLDYNATGIYLDNFDRPNEMQSTHYQNLHSESEQRLLSAVLESDELSSAQFELFVPIFINERSLYKSCLDAVKIPEDLERSERKKLKRVARLKCYKEYHQFKIDSTTVEPLNAIIEWHPNQGEYGMRFYFSTRGLTTGLHVLEIEKIDKQKDKIFRRISIPFHFESI